MPQARAADPRRRRSGADPACACGSPGGAASAALPRRRAARFGFTQVPEWGPSSSPPLFGPHVLPSQVMCSQWRGLAPTASRGVPAGAASICAATPGVASVREVKEGLGAIIPAVPQVIVSFAIGNQAQGVIDLVPVEGAKSAGAAHPAVQFVRFGRTG